jgi:anti-anti-sigma regulatory factor
MEPVPQPHILALSGPQTIREIAQTHAALLDALRQPRDVVLDCADVTAADLSFIQIILAARRTVGETGRRFALHRPPAGALAHALTRGGFLRAPASARDTDPALWGDAPA